MRQGWFTSHRLRDAVFIYLAAVAVNYPWELLQSPLFEGHADWQFAVWHCLRAALGDGFLVLAMHGAGALAQGTLRWYCHPQGFATAAAMGTGLLLAAVVEWWAVQVAARWVYSFEMPLVPGTSIGLVPLLQMVVLPPVVFAAARHRSRCIGAMRR